MQPTTVPRSQATGVPGWRNEPMDQEEQTIINFAANFIPDNGIAVEVGTEYGRGASEIAFGARSAENVTVLSFDLFPKDHPEVGNLLDCWMNNLHEARHLFPSVKNVPVIGNSSEAGAQLIAEGKLSVIHFLFIDGAHDANGTRRDLDTFAPLVSPDGVLLIHDYWKNEASHYIHKDVKQAVDAWYNADQWNRVDLPGSLIGFFRLNDPKHEMVGTINEHLHAEDLRETLVDDERADLHAISQPSAYETPAEAIGDWREMTINEIADYFDVSYNSASRMVDDPIGKKGRANLYRINLDEFEK